MSVALHVALILAIPIQLAPAPLRIKVGDTLAIVAPQGYSGTFTVLSDGAIYGATWGRVAVAGLTWEQSQSAVRNALARFVRTNEVFLTIVTQKRDVVYVVGLAGNQGPTTWEPDLTLRRLLSGTQFHGDLDQTLVTLYRSNESVFSDSLDRVLDSGFKSDPAVVPGDVVAVTSIEKVRVWVSGAVRSPGEVKVPAGSDLSRVLAAAGGASVQPGLEDGVEVILRRGPRSLRFPVRAISGLDPIVVESGDDVSVVFPQSYKVTVDGKVRAPGEYTVNGTNSLNKAIAMAGGVAPDGTSHDVMVLRSGVLHVIDATDTKSGFELATGDLVVVKRNERAFYVFGEVNAPGQFKMEDGKTYRVLDALAAAGGITSRGVLRRVYFSQRNEDGTVSVRHLAPDETLRHGDEEHNPVLRPGDALLFTRTDGLSLAAATQVLTSLVLIDSLGRSAP